MTGKECELDLLDRTRDARGNGDGQDIAYRRFRKGLQEFAKGQTMNGLYWILSAFGLLQPTVAEA